MTKLMKKLREFKPFHARIQDSKTVKLWVLRYKAKHQHDGVGHWITPRYTCGVLIRPKSWGFYRVEAKGLWTRVVGPFFIEHCPWGFWSWAWCEDE